MMRTLASVLILAVAPLSAQTVHTDLPDESEAADIYAAAVREVGSGRAAVLANEGEGDIWACASCHGGVGQGSGTVPRLAGLSEGYIAKQLHAYAHGIRENYNMQYVAEKLTDEDMLTLARYYAVMDAPSNANANLGGDLDRGAALAIEGDWNIGVPACFSCHGSSGWGVAQAFPALAAQHAPYTYTQLAAWVDGRRKNSPLMLMQQVSHALSDADKRAVSDYLATLPAPPAQEIPQ